MDNMVVVTFLAAVISSAVAALVSFRINRESKKERFDLQLQNIIAYSMKYPYLEQKTFTDAWEPSLATNDERYQRYAHYFSIVFNFIYDVCLWKKYKQKDIENYIGIKFWVWKHEKYWKNPQTKSENDIYGCNRARSLAKIIF